MQKMLLLVLMLSGCASQLAGKANVDERLLAARTSVSAAQSEVTAAEVAKRQATQFCQTANVELDAAKWKSEAPDESDRTGRAEQALLAARAKRDYCKAQLAVRNAKVDESRAQLAVAKDDEELARVNLVSPGDAAKSRARLRRLEAKRKAAETLASAHLEVSRREEQMAALFSVWDDQRRASQRVDCNFAEPVVGVR